MKNDHEDIQVDMKLAVMKPASVPSGLSLPIHIYYLRTEAGIVHGGFVEAGICEVVDTAESDYDSEDDHFPE